MMPGWTQILLVVVLLVLLFGRGKISDLMGDVAKGIKSFKKGMADDEDEIAAKAAKTINHTVNTTSNAAEDVVKSTKSDS